jgi:hypothetical protein
MPHAQRGLIVAVSISQAQLMEIADIFASVMYDDQKRDATLQLAFQKYPRLLGGINRAGAGFTFSILLITQLNNYGEVEPGVPALRVMMEAVITGGMIDGKRLRELVIEIYGATSVPAPSNVGAQPAGGKKEPDQYKILFMSANPRDTSHIHLDEEMNVVNTVLTMAAKRHRFDLVAASAVRVSQIQEQLLRHKPNIIHIAGHGSANGELIFNNEMNKAQMVPMTALANTFKILKRSEVDIRCVVLNACYSEAQAAVLVGVIDVALGMSTAIGDKAATEFSAGFYRGLGNGQNVEIAFEWAKNQIELSGRLNHASRPQIKFRDGVKPEDVFKLT